MFESFCFDDWWSESSDTFKLLSELDESFERSGMMPKLTLLVDEDEVANCSVELSERVFKFLTDFGKKMAFYKSHKKK